MAKEWEFVFKNQKAIPTILKYACHEAQFPSKLTEQKKENFSAYKTKKIFFAQINLYIQYTYFLFHTESNISYLP